MLLCVTDPSQGEAADAVDNRSLEEILGRIPPPPPPAMTNEPGAPRLMITHLVNRNFKSYAGEQILGPFHKVRPNMVTNVNPDREILCYAVVISSQTFHTLYIGFYLPLISNYLTANMLPCVVESSK